jgi:hypothetical protein
MGKYHTLQTSIKIKRETQKWGQDLPEIEEIPKSMEVYDIIEDPIWSKKILIKARVIIEGLASQELEIFEEEFVTLHHVAYHKNSKNLLIEKVNMKNKKVVEIWKSEIDFHGVSLSKIVQFHDETKKALMKSISDMENEIIQELEKD